MIRKVDKIIDAIPMSRYEAEMILDKKIENILHGDTGYLIGDKWIPKFIVDSQSEPFDTDEEKMKFLGKMLKEATAWAKTIDARRLKTLRNIVTNFLNETDNGKKRKRRNRKNNDSV